MKILVYETSMMRNFDYDISTISKQMEGIKADADIAMFIQNNKGNSGRLMPETPPPGNTFLNVSIARVISKGFDNKLELF